MRLSEAEKLLSLAGIDGARREARLIFSRLGGVADYELLADPECPSDTVRSAIERRALRVPFAYIVGEADFYRECYKVSEACLIPRPETELLVDYAVRNMPRGAKFADVCTGSGCIAISTLKNTKDTRAVAIDISEDAISIARENAERHEVQERIEFITTDALSGIDGELFAVLSNPPYVSEDAYASLEPELYREPKIAFIGGQDGGNFYRKLIPIYKKTLMQDGFLAFEIGFDQGGLLRSLALENGMTCEIIKDYSSHDRVAVLKPKKQNP